MKKIYNLIIVCILYTGMLQAQSHKYIPFPDSNAIWVVQYLDEFGQVDIGYQYFIQKDTMINGLKYCLLRSTGDSSLQKFHKDSWYTYRNDTTNKKVYNYDRPSGKEWLLYDFSLNVGDTFPTCFHGSARYHNSVVTSIDTVQINGNEHLVFNVKYDGEFIASFVEGIGSLAGLYESTYFFEGGSRLVCQMLGKDRTPYFTNVPGACHLVHYTGIEDQSTKEMPLVPDLKVFPNPLIDQSRVELTSEADQLEELIIYNSLGLMVFRIENINSTKTIIGVHINEKGMYFIRAKTRLGLMLNSRFVK